MEDYNSRHTGPEIDEALSRVKATPGVGAIKYTDVGAAPGDYGLGKDSGKSVASWDEAKNNGWYRGPAPKGIGSGTIWGRVDSMLNNYVTQTLSTDAYPNCCVRRMCINGTWGEWEWINPPMELGKEYRTTERWDGKPVYKKRLADTTTIAGGGTATIAVNNSDTIDKIAVDMSKSMIQSARGTNNLFNASVTSITTVSPNYDGNGVAVKVTTTGTGLNENTISLCVKYTKA